MTWRTSSPAGWCGTWRWRTMPRWGGCRSGAPGTRRPRAGQDFWKFWPARVATGGMRSAAGGAEVSENNGTVDITVLLEPPPRRGGRHTARFENAGDEFHSDGINPDRAADRKRV